ncbi:Peptidyl-prolyl cis-trans isomerase cyp10 [Tulasnella sp. 417]|nr:Peptidyl-prolyl cis-trans isomerase cyp10 [Tulasnella sp. 417]
MRTHVQFNARGVLAMANSGPDTNKSQFFITYSKQAHLEGKYTIFGKVIDGADTTLDTIERVPVNEKNRPTKEIKILSVCPQLSDMSRSAADGAFGRLQITIHANPIANAQLS